MNGWLYRVAYTGFGLVVSALVTGTLYLGAPLATLVFHSTDRATFMLVEPQTSRRIVITVPIEGLDDDVVIPTAPDAPAELPPDLSPSEATPNSTPGTAAKEVKGDNRPTDPTLGVGKGAPPAQSAGPPKVRVKGPHSDEMKGAVGDKGPKEKCLDPVPEIVQLDASTWQVKRSFVESYTSSMERMNTLAALYYHKGPDGKNDGFKLKQVRCGSPLHQGGLRNGDVVHKFNGKTVTTVLDALGVYRKLKKHEMVEVELTRAGKRRTVKYIVVD